MSASCLLRGWWLGGRKTQALCTTSPRLTSRVAHQAGGGEEVYRVLGIAFGDEVGQDLTDNAAELVAVTGEAGGDGDLWVVGVRGDHEVLVRGVRVHAGLRVEEVTVEVGDVPGQIAPDELDLLIVDFAVYRLGVRRLAVGPEERRLDPSCGPVVGGDGVERVAVLGFPDKDRKAVREVGFDAAFRVEPEQDLARNPEREPEIREQPRRPRPGRDDQPLRLVAPRCRLDPHPGSRGFPRQYLLLEPEVGAEGGGPVQVGLYASLGPEEAGPLLEEGDGIRGWFEDRVAPFQLGGVQDLVGQIVLLGALLASVEDPGAWGSDHEPARDRHQVLARLALESFPQLVGPKYQGHVGGVLGIRQADDPGLAVAGAPVVRGGESLQTEHALAAGGEVVGGRATHPAEARDDHVVHQTPLSSSGRV